MRGFARSRPSRSFRLAACEQPAVCPIDQQPGDIGRGLRRPDTGERSLDVTVGRRVITDLSLYPADEEQRR